MWRLRGGGCSIDRVCVAARTLRGTPLATGPAMLVLALLAALASAESSDAITTPVPPVGARDDVAPAGDAPAGVLERVESAPDVALPDEAAEHDEAAERRLRVAVVSALGAAAGFVGSAGAGIAAIIALASNAELSSAVGPALLLTVAFLPIGSGAGAAIAHGIVSDSGALVSGAAAAGGTVAGGLVGLGAGGAAGFVVGTVMFTGAGDALGVFLLGALTGTIGAVGGGLAGAAAGAALHAALE